MLLDYLTDSRDKALLSATPTLMAPHFGKLPPCDLGAHRFVVARNGLFIQARTHVLDVCACINKDVSLPYGTLKERVTLLHGGLSADLFSTLMADAQKALPNEWAGLIVWNEEISSYEYLRPQTVGQSSHHISYLNNQYDTNNLLLDAHSHAHGRAFFSTTDDASDLGIHLSLVFGRCEDLATMETKARLCVHGHFIDFPASELSPFSRPS